MITIALDETGTFENANEKKKMIGGFIYRGEDAEQEKVRLEQFLIEQCHKFEIGYPEGIHSSVMKDPAKREVLSTRLKEYIKQNGNYFITCMLKSEREKKSKITFSNLVDEQVASNLYENMIIQLLNNLLFYNPYFIEEETIQFNLATRSIEIFETEKDRLEKYLQLGYGYKEHVGKKVFFLTDQKTFKTALSVKMSELNRKRRLECSIHVESVSYKSRDKTTPFLYAADFICSILRESFDDHYGNFHADQVYQDMKEITGNEFIFFAYDDIDDCWAQLFTAWQNRDFITTLDSVFSIYQSDSLFKGYYRSYWVKMAEESVYSIYDPEKINLYLSEVEYLIANKEPKGGKQRDLQKGIYIGQKLWERLEQSGTEPNREKTMYQLADLLVRAYNHQGDTNKARYFFQQCEQLKHFVSPEDYCATYLNVAQIYANEFDFEGANVQIERSRALLLKMKLLYQEMAVQTGQLPEAEKYALLGKIESSLGQFYSFQRKWEKAYECFEAALAEFDNPKERFITSSYILHLALDKKDEPLYRQFALDYFGSLELEEQWARIVREHDPYRLFVFVKALRTFGFTLTDSLYENLVDLLDDRKHSFITHNHPWEIIYKHLAMLFYEKGNAQYGNRALYRIGKMSKDGAEETILVLNEYAGMMLNYHYSNNKEQAEQHFKRLQALIEENESMKRYFFDVLEEEQLEKRIEKLDSKITFTYR